MIEIIGSWHWLWQLWLFAEILEYVQKFMRPPQFQARRSHRAFFLGEIGYRKSLGEVQHGEITGPLKLRLIDHRSMLRNILIR